MLNSTEHEISCFKSLRCCIYHANCWHFNIYEQDQFHAQLSWACTKFYNIGTRGYRTNLWLLQPVRWDFMPWPHFHLPKAVDGALNTLPQCTHTQETFLNAERLTTHAGTRWIKKTAVRIVYNYQWMSSCILFTLTLISKLLVIGYRYAKSFYPTLHPNKCIVYIPFS